MNMEKVSVQIVTFNSEKYIQECVESVLQQSYPIAKILIVDNSSVDNTLKILKSYQDHIQMIENQENVGFAAAHNQALRYTQSDFVLILNPDVVLHRDYISHIVKYMINHPHIGSGTGMLLLKSSPQFIDSTGLIIKKSRRAYDRGAHDMVDHWKSITEVFGVSGAAAMYRRKMIEAVSYKGQFFDEQFFAYKEDVDVAWRSQLFGWESVYVPEAVAYHERGWKQGDRRKQPKKIRRHSYINRYRMMVKNESLWFIMMHLPFILFYEFIGFGYALIKEPELLTAWYSFLKDLPYLKEKRRWIMSNRKVPFKQVYRFFK